MRSALGVFRTGCVFVLCLGTGLSAGPGGAQQRFPIQLVPDLTIGEATGVAFGGGLRLAVDSRGQMYVADGMNKNVRVFSPDGVLQHTIGRSGHGPGEFAAIHQLVVGRNDSIYVFDANAFRLSVFSPHQGHPLAYTVQVSPHEELGYPYRLFIPSDPAMGFLFAFRQQSQGTVSVHQVDRRGEVDVRPLVQGKGSESTARVGKADGGVSVTRTSPLFGRSAVVGLTPQDELYYGWSGTIDVSFFDVTGRPVRRFRADVRPIPVKVRDVQHELERASEARRRALSGAKHPSTKPALRALIVDDRSWIWTARNTADPTVSRWWVTKDSGRGPSGIFSLPADVDLQVVRGGHAYAIAVDELGVPQVIRYTIRTERLNNASNSR